MTPSAHIAYKIVILCTHLTKSELHRWTNFIVNIGSGGHLVLSAFAECARVLYARKPRSYLKIFHKVDGYFSNCCTRWRMHSFRSFSILCSTLASTVRTIRRFWGCVISTRVNVGNRSMVAPITDCAGRLYKAAVVFSQYNRAFNEKGSVNVYWKVLLDRNVSWRAERYHLARIGFDAFKSAPLTDAVIVQDSELYSDRHKEGL